MVKKISIEKRINRTTFHKKLIQSFGSFFLCFQFYHGGNGFNPPYNLNLARPAASPISPSPTLPLSQTDLLHPVNDVVS